MAASPAVCPKCGFANQPGYQFCTNCGSVLVTGPGTAAGVPVALPYGSPYPPTYGAPPSAYAMPPWEYERRKQVDRTKTGILLLLIGSLISWVLVVGFVGEILLLVGAILVILGRRAFGAAHSRNVVVSIVLFFVGIAIGVVGAIVVGIGAVPALVTGDLATITSALRSLFSNVLAVVVIGSIVSGLASVLFTYSLQNPAGRMLLWAGYAATIAVQIALFILISQGIDDLATTMARQIATSTNDPAAIAAATNALTERISAFFYLSAIPALLFSAADYLVWNRINKGEIPAPPSPPVAPTSQAPPIQPK